MKVLNIHTRTIGQAVEQIEELIRTLATPQDKIWPFERWPRMKLDKGLTPGSKGGHGPVGYTIVSSDPGRLVEFEFSAPKGFIGRHRFILKPLSESETEVSHVIDMHTEGIGPTLQWLIAVRPLHNALAEDALDKVENYFDHQNRLRAFSPQVKFLRWGLRKVRRGGG